MTTTNAMSTFKQALLDSVLCEYRSVPCENDISVSFSDDFYRAVRSTGKAVEGSAVHISWAWFRRVLVAAVICCLIASNAVATPYKPSEQVGVIIHRTDASHYTYTTVVQEEGSMPHKILHQAPSYVPEGFEMTFCLVDNTSVYIKYERSDGAYISYWQDVLFDGDPEWFEGCDSGFYGLEVYAPNAKIYTDEVDDMLIHVIYDMDVHDSFVVWTSDTCTFSFDFSPEISQSDIRHIIHSVVPNNSLENKGI